MSVTYPELIEAYPTIKYVILGTRISTCWFEQSYMSTPIPTIPFDVTAMHSNEYEM